MGARLIFKEMDMIMMPINIKLCNIVHIIKVISFEFPKCS